MKSKAGIRMTWKKVFQNTQSLTRHTWRSCRRHTDAQHIVHWADAHRKCVLCLHHKVLVHEYGLKILVLCVGKFSFHLSNKEPDKHCPWNCHRHLQQRLDSATLCWGCVSQFVLKMCFSTNKILSGKASRKKHPNTKIATLRHGFQHAHLNCLLVSGYICLTGNSDIYNHVRCSCSPR